MPLPDHHLSELSMGDLSKMYETYRTAAEVFRGRAGQPWAEYLPAGDILDNEAERCLRVMCCIFEEARQRRMSPKDPEAHHMAKLYALHVADEEDDIAEAAAFLSGFAK
ncbi:hypothetical protein EV666_1321 [Camelimonas lactis]|uniref:Uncharacterized protein n=2 Tax=Camelimonas lactis TaxID=659006 RepID=A0A4R2GJI5_9HYPH|nr:hypothetical protein EV666_1321 [Camelimonas lactis]